MADFFLDFRLKVSFFSASNIKRKSIDEVNKLQSFQKTNQLTMKHLLKGKKALTTRTKRVVTQGVIPPIITKRKVGFVDSNPGQV